MLKNRCAIVTGSVAGLGYAIAESLGKVGANVVINGLREPATGADAARRLSAITGHGAIFDPADLTDVEAIERLFENAPLPDISPSSRALRCPRKRRRPRGVFMQSGSAGQHRRYDTDRRRLAGAVTTALEMTIDAMMGGTAHRDMQR
jgi:hypothetical protein